MVILTQVDIIAPMIALDNTTQTSYTLSLIEAITRSLTKRDVELLLTCNDEIQRLNAQHRHIDAPTDVLSFPNVPSKKMPLGSIVISDDYVQKAASSFGHSAQEEFTLLYIHGLLHLLGFDHECDNGEMRAKEEQIIKKYNLPESLIVRTLKEE